MPTYIRYLTIARPTLPKAGINLYAADDAVRHSMWRAYALMMGLSKDGYRDFALGKR
jgi:hypothetical protein